MFKKNARALFRSGTFSIITTLTILLSGGADWSFVAAQEMDGVFAGHSIPVFDGGNPSFDTPWLNGPYYQYNPTGGGWTFAGGSGISANGSDFTGGNPPTADGGQVAFLQNNYGSVISQSVSGFQAHDSYTIRFKAAQRGNWNQGGQDFDVYLDGMLLGTFRPADTAYAEMSTAPFTTTAGSHVLKFVGKNTNGGDNTAFIDNVYITNDSPHAEELTEPPNANETQVRIHFDELGHKIALSPGYNPHAVFSTSPSQSVVTWNPRRTEDRFSVPESPPNMLSRADNFHPFAFNHFEPLTVTFTKPVNGLQFAVGGIDAPFGTVALLDIYQNGGFVGTRAIPSLGIFQNVIIVVGKQDRFPAGLDNVTKIVIRNITDSSGIVFDDFIFNVPNPPQVNITSPRVGGNLQGTTQNALIGADVRLQANASQGGGSFSWSIAGPHQHISTSANGTAVLVRWTEVGTHRATVSYTLDGVTTTSFVDVRVVEPTLGTVGVVEEADQVSRNCEPAIGSTSYGLGCLPNSTGIDFITQAVIPNVAYLSDPAQSGIKYVQGISIFRKILNKGNNICVTARSSQSNVASGWQLDTSNPYAGSFARFNVGNSLQLNNDDSPIQGIEGSDAVFVDDRFEMYVYYFTGSDPTTPVFERPLKIPGSSNIARIAWQWGGQAVFAYNPSPDAIKYRITDSTTTTGPIQASGTNNVVPMQTNVNDIIARGFVPCSGTAVTTNPIDGSERFVDAHYDDFLGVAPPDQPGLDFWRSQITQCGFDLACIDAKRVDVSRAFFYSGDFIAMHPELGGARGTHEYNWSFVYWCYRAFLQREPNGPPDNGWEGFNFWLGILDSTNPDAGDYKYNQIIKAFITAPEYRRRFEGQF